MPTTKQMIDAIVAAAKASLGQVMVGDPFKEPSTVEPLPVYMSGNNGNTDDFDALCRAIANNAVQALMDDDEPKPPTDDEIHKLRAQALTVRNFELVEVCDDALSLHGSVVKRNNARAICAEAIADLEER